MSACSSSAATSALPSCRASSSAVLPSRFFLARSAPARTSSRAHSRWPYSAALCRAVRPSYDPYGPLAASLSAPHSSSASTQSALPEWAASMSAVAPPCPRGAASMFAPCWRSSLSASRCPFQAALWAAGFPFPSFASALTPSSTSSRSMVWRSLMNAA